MRDPILRQSYARKSGICLEQYSKRMLGKMDGSISFNELGEAMGKKIKLKLQQGCQYLLCYWEFL